MLFEKLARRLCIEISYIAKRYVAFTAPIIQNKTVKNFGRILVIPVSRMAKSA
jgi:hypothetical protein